MSYASEDRPRGEEFARALEGQGWTVFWDRTIPIGKTWRETIGRELSEARCVIVLWSKTSIDSSWVQEEADDARRRGVLVPVLIDKVIPPIGFRSVQAADLADWDKKETTQAFRRLRADIAALVGSAPRALREEVPPAPEGPKVEAGKPRVGGGVASNSRRRRNHCGRDRAGGGLAILEGFDGRPFSLAAGAAGFGVGPRRCPAGSGSRRAAAHGSGGLAAGARNADKRRRMRRGTRACPLPNSQCE